MQYTVRVFLVPLRLLQGMQCGQFTEQLSDTYCQAQFTLLLSSVKKFDSVRVWDCSAGARAQLTHCDLSDRCGVTGR